MSSRPLESRILSSEEDEIIRKQSEKSIFESFNLVNKSIEKLPLKKNLSKNKSSGIIFKLPYKNSFSELKKFKKNIEELIQRSFLSEKLDINFPKKCKEVSISIIKSYKSSLIIGMKNGLIFFYDFYKKELEEFYIDKNKFEEPKNFETIKVNENEKNFITKGENSNKIFIFCLIEKRLIKIIEENEIITSLERSREHIYYTLKNKIKVLSINNYEIKHIIDSLIGDMISIKFDEDNNLLYCLKKKGLYIYDMIRKLKFKNISLNLGKIKNFNKNKLLVNDKFLLFIDQKRKVLIINSKRSLFFIDLINLKIIKEHIFESFIDTGYFDIIHNVFFLYNRRIKSFLFYFDYKSDPVFKKIDLNLDKNFQNELFFYYSRIINKVFFYENKDIFFFHINTFRKVPLFTTLNEIKELLIYDNSKIVFLSIQREVRKSWEDDFMDNEIVFIDQNIVVYDCDENKLIQKCKINIDIDSLILNKEEDCIYLTGKGIKIYNIEKNILTEMEKVDPETKTSSIVLDKTRKTLYYIQENFIMIKDLNTNHHPKKIGLVQNIINLIIDQKRNFLYTSGNVLLAWDLSKRERFIIQDEDNFQWNLMSLDKKNNIIYVSKESKLYIWDLHNYKQLGLFANVDSIIISLHFDYNTNLIFISTGKYLYIYGKKNKILYAQYILESKKALITEFYLKNQNFGFMVSKTQKENNLYQYYISKWDINLLELNIYEALFFEIFIFKKFNMDFFMMNVRKFIEVYNNSYILRGYFNFYFLAAYHNLPHVMNKLYNNYLIKYPFYSLQISPLYFSLMFKFKIFSNKLVQFLELIGGIKYLKENEILELFLSKDIKIHDFIKNIFLKIEYFDNKVPFSSLTTLRKFNTLKSSSKFFSIKIYNSLINSTNEHLDLPPKSTISTTKQLFYEKLKNITTKYNKSQQRNRKNIIQTGNYENIGTIKNYPTKFYRFIGKYNLDIGSPGSLIFLRSYSRTNSSKFVLSNFKYIILHKWKKVFWFQLIIAIIYWIHLIFFTFILLNPKVIFYQVTIDFIFIFLLFMFEFFSFCTMKKEYFKDIVNYLDILNIIHSILSNISVLYYEKRNEYPIHVKFFQGTSLVLTSFRGIIFLKVFWFFGQLIKMIIRVFISSLPIFLLLIYVVLILGVAFSKSSINKNLYDSILNNIFIVFGEIPEDFNNPVEAIITLFGLVFTCIIMINFLIAKMANEYSNLEAKEKIFFYQDLAMMEFEFEILYQKFKSLRNKVQWKSEYYYFAYPEDKKKKEKSDDNEILLKEVKRLKNSFDFFNKSNSEDFDYSDKNLKKILNSKFSQLFELIDSRQKDIR